MATTWKAPTWRMPNDKNQNKFENYSLNFDGTSEYVDLGNDSVLTPENITVTCWVNITSGSSISGYYFSKVYVSGSSASYGLYHRQPRFFIQTSTGLKMSPQYGSSIINAGWTHLVGTYDGANVRLYVNGVEVGTGTSVTGSIVYSTENAAIGAFQFYTPTNTLLLPIKGKLSQPTVFDYALSNAQISSLYNSGSPINPMTLKPAPIASYLLGGDASTGGSSTLSVPNVAVPDASVFDFDTSDIEFSNVLNLGTTWTISFWIKTTSSLNSNQTILAAGSGNGFTMLLLRNNRLMLYRGTGADYNYFFANGDFNDGEWHNIILVRNGTKDIISYLDGNIGTNFTFGSGNLDTNIKFIGDDGGTWGTATAFDGELSNIVFWKSDQSSEISNIYNSGVPATTYTNTPTAWYKLDQSANWEADTTGNWQIPDAVSAYPQSFLVGPGNQANIQTPNLGMNHDQYPYSISYWYNPHLSSTRHLIYGSYDNGPIAMFSADYNLTIFVGGHGYITRTYVLSQTKWNHIVYKRISTSTVKIYVNGVFIYEKTDIASDPSNLNNETLRIGSNQSQSGREGFISNVQFWNADLTDGSVSTGQTAGGQIAELYNNGVPLTTAIATDNLKAWYKLDNTETYLKPAASQTQNLYESWLIENQKYPASVDKCLLFANNNAITYDNFNLINEAELTVSFWYLHDNSINSFDRILGSRDNTAYNFYVNVGRSGAANINGLLRTNDGAGGFVNHNFYFGNISTPTVGWRLLTMTYNGSVIKAYLNNEEVASVSATGTVYDLNPYVGGSRNYNQSIRDGNGSANGMRMSNVIYWNKALTASELTTLYNNGTPLLTKESIPQNSSMLLWNTLENKTETIGGGLYDKSGNSVSIQSIANSSTIIIDNVPVSAQSGVSSGMTEQNLVNNNVSALNGESSGMTSANLVTSTLTRQVPYNSYSLNFDAGNSNYINCTDSNIFSFGDETNDSPFSMSAWIKTSSSASRGIISKWGTTGTSGHEWIFWTVGSPAKLRMNLNDGTNTVYRYRQGNTNVDTGEWVHAVVTYDGRGGNDANDGIKIYVNGQEESSYTNGSAGTYMAMHNTPRIVQIGAYNSVGNFDGQISNPVIFDKELTSTEVMKLYNSGVPSDLSSFNPSPIAWWSLGSDSYYNGANYICPDLIGTNNGTSSGMDANSLVGNAPNSTANGTSANMTISANLTGNAPNSSNNSFSVNMSFDDRETDVPS